MGIFILRRLLYSIPVLIATSFIIFSFVSLAGDPLGQLKLDPHLSKVTLQQRIDEKHLDKPIPIRYLYWVKEASTQKFGTTLNGDHNIWEDFRRVIPHTLQLVIIAELLAVLIAVAIGVLSAVRQYSAFDYTMTAFSFVAFALPVFWLALMLQIGTTEVFLKWHVRLFYTSGLSSPEPGTGLQWVLDRGQHLALPVFTLTLISIAAYSRYMRASMLEVMNSDYIRTARAKGLKERRVTVKHAMRNALIPLTTVVAIDFGVLLGGAIITESIFQLDGMGYYFIKNLQQLDVYPVMAWLMVVAVMIIVFNLIADLIYGLLDPRIRLE
jgi:ABC-type dipeptide/oligopeptide/nickel transport system permease component